MIMKHCFQRLSRLLRRLRFASKFSVRKRLATLYVLLVFGFAGVYALFHNDFYNANANREPLTYYTIRDSEEHISRELQEQIFHTFENHYGASKTMFDNWSIDARTFRVMFLKATRTTNGVDIRFRLDMKLADTTSKNRSLYIDPVITLSAKERAESTSQSDVHKVAQVDVPGVPFWEKSENDRLVRTLFPVETAGVTSSGNGSSTLTVAMIPISKRLDDEIFSLAKMLQDEFGGVDDYWRMVYLSAVTITTLGYGDISPLTTRMRLLIAFEAVVGIIIIGSFINAGSKNKEQKIETQGNVGGSSP